jgi:tetratricopeptide (TPR) repeat protein
LTDHPGSEELAELVRGALSDLRMREVVRHVLLPCPPCAAVIAELMQRAADPEPVPEEEYDAAMDRALQTALLHEQGLRRRKAEAERLEAVLARDGMNAIPDLPFETDPLALIDALLARSWALRHDDPGKMVQFADLAVKQAQALDACELGVPRMNDVMCRAWAELGNALRVSDRHVEAWQALHLARQLFEIGTKDELLEVRVTELEASLAADRRQFDVALLKLTRVYRFYRRSRSSHLAGRTLILKGLYTNYAGYAEEAIQLLRQGRALLDPKRDTDLHYSAVHNELLCLVNAGRYQEAKRLRIERSRELSWGKGRVSVVRLRAVDGRLDVAEGKFARAEETFREVKQGFFELGRKYHAAIASLDLAEVLLRRGRWVEAKEEALEAIQVFQALKIGLEAYASVILLREYFELRMVTPSLIQEIAGHLRRAEYDPGAPFMPPPSLRLP